MHFDQEFRADALLHGFWQMVQTTPGTVFRPMVLERAVGRP
jgi:hypothetical protein